MAQQKTSTPETVELVSPDGKIKRKVTVGSKEEVSLRFDGFLPAPQAKLEAPKVETSPTSKTVGSNA